VTGYRIPIRECRSRPSKYIIHMGVKCAMMVVLCTMGCAIVVLLLCCAHAPYTQSCAECCRVLPCTVLY
jgi:hypothetical protein